MTVTKHASGPAIIVLCVALAACSSPPDQPSANDTAVNERVVETPAVETNTEAPTKSILRPEVVEPAPEATPLQPVDRIIAFDEGGDTLTDAARRALDELATNPLVQAGGALTVRGHSDTRGSDRVNLRSSRKRAEAVRDYLVAKGIAPDRLTVIALGETTPLVPNAHPDGSDDPEARKKNRRVEVHVALPAAPPPAEDAPVDNGVAPAT